MLYDFQAHIQELRKSDNAEKSKSIPKYEKAVLKGKKITGDVKDQVWYMEYLSKFQHGKQYKIPEELKDDFDWELLYQLASGSFSSFLRFKLDDFSLDGLPELEITVHSGDTTVVKNVSELWGFQILRLYEIWVEEQMNLEILRAEDKREKAAIDRERELRLKTELNRSIERDHHEADIEQNEPLVYHYTTLNSFFCILKYKKIFASSLKYLNDSSEIEHGISITKKIFQAYMDGNKNMTDDSPIKHIKLLYESIESKFASDIVMSAICFSNNGNMLSQWRAYADNGKGFSLGFNKQKVKEYFEQKFACTHFDVEYKEQKQEEIIRAFIDEHVSGKNAGSKKTDETLLNELTGNASDKLVYLVAKLKNEGFIEENEFRVVFKDTEEFKTNIKCRVGQSYLIPYAEIDITELLDNALERIYIGPSSSMEQKLTEGSIRMFLKEVGIKRTVQIESSKIPYRI